MLLQFSLIVAPLHALDVGQMHRGDSMKADLLSRVLLVGSGIVIALSVIVTLIAAFTRIGSLT